MPLLRVQKNGRIAEYGFGGFMDIFELKTYTDPISNFWDTGENIAKDALELKTYTDAISRYSSSPTKLVTDPLLAISGATGDVAKTGGQLIQNVTGLKVVGEAGEKLYDWLTPTAPTKTATVVSAKQQTQYVDVVQSEAGYKYNEGDILPLDHPLTKILPK